jgi:predicted permease
MRVEDQVRRGVPEEEAREEAMRRFGEPEAGWEDLRGSVRRRERRRRLAEMADELRRGLVLTLRQARRAPGYVALSILTLALGVGLTTAAFTVTERVLLRPLPYVAPERLVRLYSGAEATPARINVSDENWIDWKEGNRTLEATALHRDGSMSVGGESGARRVPTVEVTGDFFRVMRTPMLLGRGFTDQEGQAEERVVVVSESFWRTQLGSTTVLPAELRLDGRAWQVIGVVPEEHVYPAGRDVWVPMRYAPRGFGAARNWINFNAVARLAAGATIAQADADLDAIADRIRAEWPEGIYSWGVHVVPLRDAIVGDAREQIEPLAAAALFILLIGCANVAGMSLARTLTREREVAVHVALGAGRGRVVRQIVSEHLYLGLAGGAAGVFIAWATTRILSSRIADLVPRAGEIGVDATVLVFAVGVSVLAGLLAGAIPGWKASGMPVRSVLQGSRGSVGSAGRTRAGAALVAAEVAVAVMLISSCGLLIRSFRTLLSRDLGFRVENVVAAEANLSAPVYSGAGWDERRIQYWESAMERVRAVPGVQSVAVGNWVPTGSGASGFIRVPGRDEPEQEQGAGYRAVSAGYFDVLDIPLIMGRVFDERDRAGTQRVTVINQAMAERYWPGENPLGQTVHALSMESYYDDAPPLTVVGVVGNVRHFGFDDVPTPEMFTLFSQVPWLTSEMTLLAYAPSVDAEEAAVRIQRPLAGVDPDIAVEVSTFERRTGDWVSERRFLMTALTAFAVLALGLAAIGIYGLLSFTVAQRTREMGIRSALGAQRMGIVGLMMSRAARLCLHGTLLGVLLAVGMTRVIRSMLVDVAPTDPATWAVTLAVLGICCAAAAFVPAWRAARTDPLVALRQQ